MSVQLNDETLDALYELEDVFGGNSGSSPSRENFEEELFGGLAGEVGEGRDGMTLVNFEQTEGGFDATFSFDDYNDATNFLLAENDGFFDSVSVERDGDTWVFEANISSLMEELGSGSAGSSGLFGEFDEVEEVLSSSLQPELLFSFEFPGSVTESNATSVNGSRATWEVDENSSSTLSGTWTPESGTPPVLLLLAAGGAVITVVITAATLLIFSGRKETSAPPA